MLHEICLTDLYFDISDNIIVSIDKDELVSDINKKGCEVLGYQKKEIIGKNWFDNFLPEKHRKEVKLLFHQMLEGRTALERYQNPVLTRNGSERIIAWHNMLLRDGVGNVNGSLSSGEDITESKLSEEKYKTVVRTAVDGFWLADLAGRFLDVNDSYCELIGYSRAELLKMRITDVEAAETPEETVSHIRKIVATGHDRFETRHRRKDGQVVDIEVSVNFMDIEGGRLFVFLRNITEHKKVDLILRENERKYRELADSLAEGVFETDVKGTVAYANKKAFAYIGLDENDLKRGINIFDYIAASYRDFARERFGRVLQREEIGPEEYLVQRKDGTTFPALIHSLAIIRDGKVLGIRGIFINITELKLAKKAARESEEKYRSLFTNLSDGFAFCQMIFDESNRPTDFIYIEVNDAFENLTGLKKSDVIGKKVTETIPSINETNPEIIPIYGKVALTGEPAAFEVFLQPLNIWLAIKVYCPKEGYFVAIFDNITERKKTEERLAYLASFPGLNPNPIVETDVQGNVLYMNPATESTFPDLQAHGVRHPFIAGWEEINIEIRQQNNPLRRRVAVGDAWYEQTITHIMPGQRLRFYGIDVTAAKTAEEALQKYSHELEEANNELQQFAYVASHDLREPLRMITSFTQSLEKRYKDKLDKTANEYINFIVDGASRMQSLIDDLLIYSRVGTRGVPFEPVEMEQVLNDVLTNLKMDIEENKAKITRDSLPLVQADPTQMMQLLQNLVSNAIKFHREKEVPTIHVSAKQDKNEWVFSITDNGIGIDPELFGRLFTLFQRLNPPDKYKGTGVGLAVAKKIVQRHGGRIWVESQPGRGSTFYFSLPMRSEVRNSGRE